jgi:hypothetical protein
MTLDNLVGKGLQRESADAAEIDRFLSKIDTKLRDARAASVSLDSRFDIAYEAILQVGLVALRAHNLRPDSRGGHHVLALQTLETSIGLSKEKVRTIDRFRRWRAQGLYDGSFEPSEAEVSELMALAESMRQTLIAWLRQHRPSLFAELSL